MVVVEVVVSYPGDGTCWYTIGFLARPGHLIYCYGNCNRDIDTNDPAAAEESGEDLLKKFWLEAIERPCDQKRINKQPQRPHNKKPFTVRFCD